MAHGTLHEDHAPGATHEALPIDPEHDIDAKSATLWVAGGAIVLFLSLWLMVPIFIRVQEVERESKIYGAPTAELDDVLEAERDFLGGANPTRKRIEDVMKQLTPK